MKALFTLALFAALALPSAQAAGGVPQLAHVVVIVFENKEEQQVVGAREAPTFTRLARAYARLRDDHGVAHPSLPNYLALVSGATHGIRTDCTSCSVSARNLADTLEQAGRTWKTYAEGLPRPGFTGASTGRYAKKHDPFLYFRDVAGSPSRRQNVVPFTQLAADLRAQQLPDFALVIPDMCHSMHDCSVRTGDRWLARTIPPLLNVPGTAIFVTFDEGAAPNHVPALVLGTAVKPHVTFARRTNHYGLLRTIEDAWGLPPLGASAHAAPITGIWR